jgi:hypothetical protein
MNLERTANGLEARLKITGLSRFVGVAFLALWLCFWAVGEAFPIWFLTVGAWALLTGNPPEPGRQPLSPKWALPVGLFLLFWLAFWTLGGGRWAANCSGFSLAATASA